MFEGLQFCFHWITDFHCGYKYCVGYVFNIDGLSEVFHSYEIVKYFENLIDESLNFTNL